MDLVAILTVQAVAKTKNKPLAMQEAFTMLQTKRKSTAGRAVEVQKEF